MRVDEAKRIVTSGYDQCARVYAGIRSRESSSELSLLTERLTAPTRILDVGCGAGIPVTAALSLVGSVIGVDISATQIALARKNVPSATFVQADITSQEFEDGSFGAIVAFYSLFHIPRDEQFELLAKLTRWLSVGGYLFATLAISESPGYTEPDFFGVTMYWSHYEASWYVDRLVEAGFEIIHLGVIGHGYDDHSGLPPEQHPVVLARKRLPNQPASGR